jgi:serine/threonine protein kinase
MPTCSFCKTENLDGSVYCNKCGGSMSGATGQLSPDTILERHYVIVKTLGRGGMGAVYQAFDRRLNNRPVAIKEMSTNAVGLGNLQAAVLAFRAEASMLINLRHNSIPVIHDFFARGEDRWYLVMDYIEGTTLKQTAQERGQIPEVEVLDWAKQLCDILDFLHTRKPPVIFRDLKPANIMLTPDGVIKLIDFGIARHFRQGQTADTAAYGSAGFAPPEQYGQNQTDARSDIFALGATLHYLLTGVDPEKTPFTFDPPSKSVKVSPEFEAVLMKMVDLRAVNRPSSVADVCRELANIDVKAARLDKPQPEKTRPIAAEEAGSTAKGSMDPGLAATTPVFMPEVEENKEDKAIEAVQAVEPVVEETTALDETAAAKPVGEEAKATQPIQTEGAGIDRDKTVPVSNVMVDKPISPGTAKPVGSLKKAVAIIGILMLLAAGWYGLARTNVDNIVGTVDSNTDSVALTQQQQAEQQQQVGQQQQQSQLSERQQIQLSQQSVSQTGMIDTQTKIVQVSKNTQTTQSTNSSANFISEFNMSESIKNDTMEPINITDKYAPNAAKFFITAKLDNAPANTAVIFDWFYVESGDQKIDSANVTADGTRFISSNLTRGNNLWPAGKYEVRILVNGNQIVKVPYMVEGATQSTQNNPPQQTNQITGSDFIGSFKMSTGVNNDTMKPVNITSQFTPTTQVLYVTAKLDNAPEKTNIKFEWYFMGANQLIDTAVLTTGGTRYISSNLNRANNAWPVGKYEVRIYVNGTPVKILPFIVQ